MALFLLHFCDLTVIPSFSAKPLQSVGQISGRNTTFDNMGNISKGLGAEPAGKRHHLVWVSKGFDAEAKIIQINVKPCN